MMDIIEQPLSIGARQDVVYDDNVVQGSSEAAEVRGLKNSEFIVTPSATVNFGHNGGRFGVSFNGVFGYDFHQKNTVLDRERIDFSGSAAALVGSSCSVTGQYAYLRKQTRQQDLTTIVTANRVMVYVATLGQTCIAPSGLTESVQILRSAWHNSSVLNINNDRKAVSGLLGYTAPAWGLVGATFLYERTDFFGRRDIMVMTPDTLEKTSVGIQYASPIDKRLSGSLSAGYVFSKATVPTDSRLAGPRGRGGLVAQASILYKPTNRWRIAGQAARKIRHDTSFTVTTDLQLSVDYTVTPTIRSSAGGRWLRDRYYGRDVTLTQIAQDRQDQTTLFGTLAFQVGKRSTLTADARHDIGRSDFSPFDYSGTRFTLSLSTSLGPPFR
ncbi:outer membrane beta-barrel protein [Novosphingobium sp. Rr 2-17]|uniref:outer membrane beta-barrel protein n=1 Tax=Novosphingobium sp. Rr 2-17 TaxID=555793 RepID=UPI0012F6EF83